MSSRASVASPRCAFCTSRRSTSRATWRGAARRAGCCSNGRPTTSCRWRMTRRRWTEAWKRSPRPSEPWDDGAVRVIILGSAAGGGLPQWNCGCANCRAARDGGAARTQSSVAVSADGERWILLNASPDLRVQLGAHRALWPRGARGTPSTAVIPTAGEIDHTLGLMLLREGTSKLPVYAPTGVAALLGAEWPLYRVLAAYAGVDARALPEARPLQLADAGGESDRKSVV